jgi:hypothetical protein
MHVLISSGTICVAYLLDLSYLNVSARTIADSLWVGVSLKRDIDCTLAPSHPMLSGSIQRYLDQWVARYPMETPNFLINKW